MTISNCMGQSPSWETNRFSDSQGITRILCNPKYHYRIHKIPHLHLSWASSILSIPPHSTSWKSILILSSHLSLGFPQVSPPNPVYACPVFHTRYLPRTSHSSRFFYPNNIGWGVQVITLLIDKWVPITTAWRVLRFRMEEQPPIWRVAVNVLNKQSWRIDREWSFNLRVGRGVNNSSP